MKKRSQVKRLGVLLSDTQAKFAILHRIKMDEYFTNLLKQIIPKKTKG